MISKTLQSALISVSAANLIFLRAWGDLLPPRPDEIYYRKQLPGLSLYLAVAADTLLLAGLIFFLIRVAPKLPRRLQGVLLLVQVAAVAVALRSVTPGATGHSLTLNFGIGALLMASATAGICLNFQRAVRVARSLALAAAPCLAITFAASPVYLALQAPLPPDPPLAPKLPGRPPVRVLWILFDDWDQRLTFSGRTEGLALPVLDALTRNSFNFSRALTAENGTVAIPVMSTMNAVPFLLYGRQFNMPLAESATVRQMPDTNMVFGEGDHIFARIRASGWNAAAVGWTIPYCRIFNPWLTDCYWDVRYQQTTSAGNSIPGAMLDEARMLSESRVVSPFGQSLTSRRHFAETAKLLAAARRYAADPAIGFALIHLNLPHIPYPYEPELGLRVNYSNSQLLYDRALKRVDAAVGEILAALHQSGLDEKTALILSSDHPFRDASEVSPYVPYIVHLPGQQSGYAINQEFSVLRTPRLVMALARGEADSLQTVERSLDIYTIVR